MNKRLVIVFAIIVIAALVLFVIFNQKVEQNAAVSVRENQTITDDKDVNTTVQSGVGPYEAYEPQKVSLAETNDVVLFFHASWCPSCRALNSDIEKNLALIPSGKIILKIDYDKEIELKKKYGVTTQHTLVQVDKDGNSLKKWSGGATLEDLLLQII